MAFSQAQFQAAVDKIHSGMGSASEKINQLGPTAQTAMNQWYIPESIVEAVEWCVNKLIEISETILKKLATYSKVSRRLSGFLRAPFNGKMFVA